MTANGTNLFMTEEGISLQQANMSKDEVQQNIARIMDWIRGPGNKLLISQNRLPLSFDEADDIRKAHEQFEFKCMQALAMYARLRDPRDLDFTTADGIDQMEQSVKAFMQNLQHRRNVVVTCYTFFRLVKELRDLMGCTDQLAEMLEAAHDLDSAERCLARLNTTLKTLDTKYGLLARECERVRHLIDQIQVMQEVERSMDELREHLTATTEWLKLRALETKKTLQVLTCEKDARQGNAWLGELGGRLIETYYSDCVGKTPVESGDRLEAHRRLETKASEAHEYCKQLAHALVLMYRAAGRDQAPVDDFTAETSALWQRLAHLMQETSERLEVADAFYRNVDILLSRVEQLLILISRDLDAGTPLKQVRNKYGRGRDELLGEFEETKNMGMALMERISVDLEEGRPLEGVEAVDRTHGVIKMKLYTLWLKIREFLLLLGQKLEITAWIERWEVIKIQIDRLYELMLRHEERWRLTERLPRTLVAAEEALAEHRRAGNDVTRLYEQVTRDLEPLLAAETNEDEAVRTAAAQETERLRKRKGEWDGAWRQQKVELEHRHDLLVRLNDLEKEVELREDLLDKCKQRSLGEERPVREADGQISHWLQDLPDLRRRVNEFFTEIRATVGDDFEPHSGRLRQRWERYEAEIDLFRWLVETALEILAYLDRAHAALRRAQAQAPTCRSIAEIDALLQELAAITAEGRQLVRPDEVREAARKLFASTQPVEPLLKRLAEVFVIMETVVEEVSRCKTGLGEETIAMTHVTAVRSAPPQRPSVSIEAGEARCGGELEMIVNFPDLSERPTVTWFKNGRPWEPRPPWRESWSAGQLRLWRPNAAPADAGRYACIVEDGRGGRTEAATEVAVMQPPAFPRAMEPKVEVQEGDPLLLQCQVSGEPEPRCQWFHQGHPLSSRRGDLQVDNGDGVCAVKIPRVQPRHAGTYELRASSNAGEAVVKTTVTVQGDEQNDDAGSVASRLTLDSDEQKSVSDIVDSFNRGSQAAPPPPRRESPVGRPMEREISATTTKPSYRASSDIPDSQKRPWALHRDYYQSMPPPRKPENDWPVPPPYYPTTEHREKLLRPSMSEPLNANEECAEKETLRLAVSYEGSPPPDVIWYKDRLVLSETRRVKIETTPTSSTLTVKELQASDSGLYAAVIKNQMGSERTTSQVTVRKPGYAPTLLRQTSREVAVNEGTPATLEFIVSAEPPAEVTWYKAGRVIRPGHDFQYLSPDDGLHQLLVRQAYLEDSGQYRAVAENIHGSKEVQFQLLVERMPEEELMSADIVSSQRAAPPTWNWASTPPWQQPEDTPKRFPSSREWRAPPRDDEPEEVLKPIDTSRNWVAPPADTTSEDAQSPTFAPRTWSSPPIDHPDKKEIPAHPWTWATLIDQPDEVLTVASKSRTWASPPAKEDDPKPLKPSRKWRSLPRDDEPEEVLTPVNTSKNWAAPPAEKPSEDVQPPTTVPTMSDGAPTPAPPTVTDQMDETQTCSAGDRVFLRCRLGGHPPPLISWYKDNVKIDNSDEHQMSSFGEEQRLVIPDAKPEDSGMYKLVATNVMGTVENECELKIVGSETDQMRTTLIFHNTVVKSPPEFVQLFRDEICKTGDTVVLQCQIVGLPAPTVWWSYNGEMLDESRCQFESQGERYSLVIPNVRPDDSGRYSITAENSSGVATCSSLVIVEEHGKTGAIERSTYSRSSSRPLSPLLSLPMPNHSQLSHLAPAVQIERVRTVEVSPGGSTGDKEGSSMRLFVERSQTSGSSLCGVVLNTLPDVREQLSSLSPGSIIVASQTTRQNSQPPSRRTTIIREYEQKEASPPASPSKQAEAVGGRRQFGRAGSNIPVRIVRETTSTKTEQPRHFTVSASPAGGRYSMVESSEYDSD